MTATKKNGPRANEVRSDEAKTWESNNATVAPFDRERVERLRRLKAAEESRKAALKLDELIESIEGRPRTDSAPLALSDALNRRTANDLASRGFDPEYLANLFGLPLKHQATAPERSRASV